MYRIAGRLQNYAWGIKGGLAPWRADTDGNDKPDAELWFGAHPNGPSNLVDQPADPGSTSPRTLRDVVDPNQVTLLVKLLAAARPLSIQIHPAAPQAERMFAAQQADPSLPKLLADSLAKTEMLIAVKPFSVLQGMRDSRLAESILRCVGGAAIPAADLLAADDVSGTIRYLLALSPEQHGELSPKLPAAAAAAGLNSGGVEALQLVADDFPGDPGVLVSALLDQRVLAEGQAVYVPAGVVHAYVCGTGVEVMASSDNVLRLGLTPKAVAVDPALEAMQPDLEPHRLSPEAIKLPAGGTVREYRPHGAPFEVEWLTDGQLRAASGRYRLVLAVAGSATVAAGGTDINLETGQAVAILATEPDVMIRATGSVFVATDVQ